MEWSWRKQWNKVRNLLMESEDIEVLKNERLFLETKMEFVIAVNQRLLEALPDDHDRRREVCAKFESNVCK